MNLRTNRSRSTPRWALLFEISLLYHAIRVQSSVDCEAWVWVRESVHIYGSTRAGLRVTVVYRRTLTNNNLVLQPATRIPPQPSHTETPTHIETRTHYHFGDTIEKSQAPDDGCINVRNMLSIEEVAEACYTDTTPTQPHRKSNTHRNKNIRPMWWYSRKVTGFWWWMY
jgi:hypothetical protein